MKFVKISRNSKCVGRVRIKSTIFVQCCKRNGRTELPRWSLEFNPKGRRHVIQSRTNVSACIAIHQAGKKELAVRVEAETYRVFSIDSTRLRRTIRTGTRTYWGYIYPISKCLMYQPLNTKFNKIFINVRENSHHTNGYIKETTKLKRKITVLGMPADYLIVMSKN